MSALVEPQARRRTGWLHSPWLRPFNDQAALNNLVQWALPKADLSAVRARVEAVVDETQDTRSFVLACNRHWRGFKSGQHVLVTLSVRGRLLQRCFSISSLPTRGRRFTITVKRQSASGVTAWMHQHLTVGTVVTLSQASGAFVLADPLPTSLLMIAAGSGITPLMSMLQALQADGYTGRVRLLYCSRNAHSTIFGRALQELEASWPTLQIIHHFSDAQGRLDAAHLQRLVPDYSQSPTWVCGPNSMMDWIRLSYEAEGAAHLLKTEAFGLPVPAVAVEGTVAQTIRCELTEQTFAAHSGQPLLVAAEQAGLSPPHGCRIGICRSCQCRKRSGVVENLLTGELCSEPNQLIQLCISSARSALTLDI